MSKKHFFCMLALMTFVAVNSLARTVSFTVGIDDTTGTMPDYSKIPPAPVVDLNGNVLTFLPGHDDYTVSIVDEDDTEVYSVFVPTSVTTVTLPFEPDERHKLLLLTGNFYYYYTSTNDPIKVDGIVYFFNWVAKTAMVTYDHFNNPTRYSGTVNIPASVTYEGTEYRVTSIDSEAFAYCTGLTSVTIPEGVIAIGHDAFYNCKMLTSINIPASVRSIGVGAFADTGWMTSQPDGVLYLDNWVIGYKGEMPTGELNIAEGTKAISIAAFYGCSGLTSVTFPNSMTMIEASAFADCTGLASMDIPGSLASLGSGAFAGCSSLTSVTIPASLASIEGAAFANCSGLTSVAIEDGVTSIGERAFMSCTSLTSVTIPGSINSIELSAFEGCTGLASVVIEDGVTSIAGSAFSGCRNMTSVSIPSSVTSIGSGAFQNCWSLASVTFPASLTSIGDRAFATCTSLTSITIPASVTSIGEYAFAVCTSVMSVKSYIKEPYNVKGLFSDETCREGTLYVPVGTKDLYIRFDGWREFLKIEEMDDEGTPNNGVCATPVIVVADGKFKFQCETPGAEFTSSVTTEENFTGDEVTIGDEATYTLTVYATAPGYTQSKPAIYRFTVSKGDVNHDGAVNVADISAIITIMAEKQ